MAILSFQSRVVYGHVGHAVAEFALRRLGLDVWPIDTVSFSNQPGHGRPGGRVQSRGEIDDLVEGLATIGVLPECDAVLSGYLGSAGNGRAVLAAVARVRAVRADALYCCDPVMGDRDGGLYVDEAQVRFFREEAVPAADILTPNHFELETLAAAPLPGLGDVCAAVAALRAQGPRIVLVSSLIVPDFSADLIGTLATTGDDAWLVTTPRRALRARGTGDLLAALFLAHMLRGEAVDAALSLAVASTFAVIEATGNAAELRLMAAQDRLARPLRLFSAHRLARA